MNAARHDRRAAAGFATSTPPATPPLSRGDEVAMREIMAEDGSIDVAAAYEAAVPLSGRMALLDTIAAELGKRGPTADYYQPLRDGRLRLLAYQAPRRLDEPPVLLPVDLVDKVVAGWKHNPDPEWTIDWLTSPRRNLRIGNPRKRLQSFRDDWDRRELQRVRDLPRTIYWRAGELRFDGMVFTDCRVIRAVDLAAHTRGSIPHGHQERVVSKACEPLWADGAQDWLAKEITLPMIAEELISRAGPNSLLASVPRSSFEKAIGKARSEAREQAGRK